MNGLHRARRRAYIDTRLHASTRQIKLMLKIVSIHTDRVDALGVMGFTPATLIGVSNY